jgi:2-alkyl-3-oxoalkanoate reductase
MTRIGVVGASGFVGNRAIEMLQAGGFEVVPILRSASSANRLTQKNLDYRVANSFNRASLQAAFQDCDVIIHSILGSPGLIQGSVTPAYQAAERARVKRILYLSSMIVHTSAPAPGTTEATPPIENQPFPTHNAKIQAERKLLQLRQKGDVEVVIFRPGIVFGPRSRWVTELATQLVQGTAYFINDGKGICNSVYVDNLIHALQLAVKAKDADGEAFFVGDLETATWFDFYRPFAEAFGVNPDQIPCLPVPEFHRNRKQEIISTVRESELMQKMLAMVSDDFKKSLRQLIPKRDRPVVEAPIVNPAPSQPVVTEMMATLQQSQYQLPFHKAEKLLGYAPIVSFDQGCQRSISWLAEYEAFQSHLTSVMLLSSSQPG